MRRKTAQALALRARIVLTCAEGGQNKDVAAKLGLERGTVGKWRRRFVEQRVAGLHDEPRSGAPRTIDDARIEAVIVRTLGAALRTPLTGVPATWRRPAA
jgi:transposase